MYGDMRPINPDPIVPYEPAAEPGGMHLSSSEGRVTAIIAPVGWARRSYSILLFGSVCLLLPCALLILWRAGLLRGQPRAAWPSAAFSVLFMALGAYVAGYAYYVAHRSVRIDLDETCLRRTILSPFGTWERSWDARRITELHRSDFSSAEPHEATHLFFLLYVKTRDGRLHTLFDSPDRSQIDAVEAALRATLDLAR
jgi:hypothetical protein